MIRRPPSSPPFPPPPPLLFESATATVLARRNIRRSIFETRWCTLSALPCVGLIRSEEHTSELQSPCNLVCRLLLEKKKRRSMESRKHHSLGATAVDEIQVES